MPRYINSADALNTLKHLSYETALNQHDPYVADVFEDIAKNRLETWVDLIPTADVVERKKGKWKLNKDGNWACPFCEFDPYHDNMKGMNYCPNCGADMRGEGYD